MRSRAPASLCVVWAAGAAMGLAGGCGPPTAAGESGSDFALVVAQVPAGVEYTTEVGDVSLDSKYPEGSRVILVRTAGTVGDEIVLSEGLAAAGAPAVAPGGDAILFAGRPAADARWGIYESDANGGRRRHIVRADRDCTDPAYLAANRIVFACADPVNESASGSLPRWSLYTATRGGSEIERITFAPGSTVDPTPLQDGRVLFSMRRGPVESAAGNRFGPFTLNPDGTLVDAFAGNEAPGDSQGVEGLGSHANVLTTLRDDPGWHVVEVVALLPSPAPRGRPSSVDHGITTGTLICYDAARSDGIVGPSVDAPLPARVVVQTLSAVARTTDAPAAAVADAFRSGAPPGQVVVELGSAAVAEDGSFYVEIPADTPVRVLTLQKDGDQIATSGWFWVRPGETRACFGCHPGHEAAPVNKPVDAITRPPVAIGQNPPGGTR